MAAKRYARQSYPSFTKSVVDSHPDNILSVIGSGIKSEFSHMSSTNLKTIIKCDGETIQMFSWDAIWGDLKLHMPMFTSFLESFQTKEDILVNCVVGCMLLKKRNQSLAFLQRTLSTFFYANGASKKVCTYHECASTIICL